MSKAHDPEAQPQMETVFDCCGTIKITYPAALEDQLRDGIANATAVPNTNLKQFTLTVGGENLLDIDLTWNPNPPGASGTVAIQLKPVGDCKIRQFVEALQKP